MNQYDKPIIFFDGYCGLCDGFVSFALKRDRRRQFYFSPLQGETAKQVLNGQLADPAEWSIILVTPEKTYDRSDAILRIVPKLSPFLAPLAVFRWVPRPIRDGLYRWLARNRYRWFKKREACRLPTPDEREQFLP